MLRESQPQYNNNNSASMDRNMFSNDDEDESFDASSFMYGMDQDRTSNNNNSWNQQFASFNTTERQQVRENSETMETSFDNLDLSDSYGDEYLGDDILLKTMRPKRSNNEDQTEDEDETLLQTASYEDDRVEQFIKGEDFAGLSKEIEKLLESDNATPRLGNQTSTPLDNIGEEYSSLSNNSAIHQGETTATGTETKEAQFITDEEAEERLRLLLTRLDKSKISEINNKKNSPQQSNQYIPSQQQGTSLVPEVIDLETTSSPKTRERTPSKKIEEIIEKYEYLDSVSHHTETKPVHSSNDDLLFDNSANYSSLNRGDISLEKKDPKKLELTSNNGSAPSTPSLSSLISENINQNITHNSQEKEVELSNISTIHEDDDINNIIETKLEPISQLLRSSGYAGFLGETDIVKSK